MDGKHTLAGLFDYNHTGTLNFEQFTQLWAYVTQWTQVFQQIDRDRSGNLDPNEVKQALTNYGAFAFRLLSLLVRAGYRLSDQFYRVLFSKFDRTGSGKFLFDDFVQVIRANLSSLMVILSCAGVHCATTADRCVPQEGHASSGCHHAAIRRVPANDAIDQSVSEYISCSQHTCFYLRACRSSVCS